MAASPHAEPVEVKQPLTLWEKIKAGAKGFAKTALHYLPRGLMFAAALLGGSALLGATVGWDPFGTAAIQSVGQLATRVATTLLIGSAIAGGVGAWHEVSAANKQREEDMLAQQSDLKRGRSIAKEREQEMSFGTDAIEQPKTPLSPEKMGHLAHLIPH